MRHLNWMAFLTGLALAPCAMAQQSLSATSTSPPPPRDAGMQQDSEGAKPAEPKNALDGFLNWLKENAEPANGGGDGGIGERSGGGDSGDSGH